MGWILLVAVLIGGGQPGQAAGQTTCYAVGAGNWSDGGIWSGSSGGSGGTCSGANGKSYPNDVDDAVIEDGNLVTNDVVDLTIATLTVQGSDLGTLLDEGLALSENLTVSGPIRVAANAFVRTYTADSTGNPTGSGVLTVQDTIGIVSGTTSTEKLVVDRESGGTGALDADSSVTNEGTLEIRTSASDAVSIAGDFTNDGTFSATSGAVSESADATVTLDGSDAQTVGGSSGVTVYSLVITNTSSGGVTFNTDVTTTHQLDADAPLTIGSGTTYTLDSGSTTPAALLGANFTNSGTLSTNGQTVRVDGTSTLSGNTTSVDTLDVTGTATLSTDFNVAGDLTVDGSLDATTNDPVVALNSGTGTQTIGGTADPLTFHVLEINNSSGNSPAVDLCSSCAGDGDGTKTVIIDEDGTSPGGRLLLTQGEFDVSNGDLVLASSGGSGSGSSQFGRVEYQGGTVTGNTVAAQLDLTAEEGWRFLTTTVGGNAVDFDELLQITDGPDATNDLWTQGFTGGDATSGESSVRYYDPSSGSWTSVSGITDALAEGRGYIVQVYSDDEVGDGTDEGFPKLIDAQDTLRNSTSFSFSNQAYWDNTDNTFNLVANPYATPLDWGNSGWNKGETYNTIYIWDVSAATGDPNGDYRTANGSSFGDSNDKIIAPFQAFFVEANGTTNGFEVSDVTSAQASSDGIFRKSVSDDEGGFEFRLTLDSLRTGTTVMWWRDKGERGRDPHDAYQLAPMEAKLFDVRLYSLLSSGTALDINTLPRALEDTMEVPLAAEAHGCVDGAPLSGTATLSWPRAEHLPDDWKFRLLDTAQDSTLDLRTADPYEFALSSDADCSSTTATRATSPNASRPRAPIPVQHDGRSKSSTSAPRFTLQIIPNAAIPVELATMQARVDGKDVVLEWTTASETNNAGFTVQHRRGDSQGAEFENLGFVESKAEGGTSTRPLSYVYATEKLNPGRHVFRLKQIDVEGGATLSDTVAVTVGLTGAYRLQVFPSPLREQGTVRFAVRKRQPVTVELYDMLGRRVRVLHRGPVPAGRLQQVRFHTGSLASGRYIVRLQGAQVTGTRSVTIVR